MNEKELKEQAEEIIDALHALSIGKEPGLLSGNVFKKLAAHPSFLQIRDTYVNYLKDFDGKIETGEEIRKLFELRMSLCTLYNTTI